MNVIFDSINIKPILAALIGFIKVLFFKNIYAYTWPVSLIGEKRHPIF
jgi:hypothetical protein